MKITTTTEDDGTRQVTFEHGGVSVTRSFSPIADEEGAVDEAAMDERVAHSAAAIETKIVMGIITADSEMMQNVGAEPLPTPPAYSPIVKNKPEA